MDVVYQPNKELKKKLAEQQNEPAKRRRAAQTNEAQAAPEAPKKKEGCYIATAVYGSYDAPEVRTKRLTFVAFFNRCAIGGLKR